MPGRKLCQRGALLRLPPPPPLLARGVAAGLAFCVRRAGAAAASASASSVASLLAVVFSGQLPLPSGPIWRDSAAISWPDAQSRATLNRAAHFDFGLRRMGVTKNGAEVREASRHLPL